MGTQQRNRGAAPQEQGRTDIMKTKLDDLNISNADKKLVRDVQKTRNLPSLTAFVKAAICRRDSLLGKEVEEFEFDFEKCGEKRSRARAQKLCDAILRLEDGKAVSVLCATAIATRKEARARAA